MKCNYSVSWRLENFVWLFLDKKKWKQNYSLSNVLELIHKHNFVIGQKFHADKSNAASYFTTQHF